MQLNVLLNKSQVVAARPSRRTVVPRASNIADDAANGIVRNFAPPTSTLKDIKRPEGEYKGSKSHNRASGPFKDGFDASNAPAKKKAAEGAATEEADAEETTAAEGTEGGPMEYLGEAAKALAAKNFSNSTKEAEWMNTEPKGYKGASSRGHGDAGFHAKK